jgi:NAD(P)-dependent dehydrogenase (short-subunit alcohol dehydrogenase family)
LSGRRKAKLAEVGQSLGSDRYLIRASDVSNVEDVEQLTADTVRRFGRIDILVNNAGIGARGGFLDLPVEDWHRVFAINVDGVFNMTRSILPHLIETQGAIINVSSVSGLGGDRGLNFYNATKGAASNLTHSLAVEFGPKGVRINAGSPSVTFTDLNMPTFEQFPELLRRQLETRPTRSRRPARGGSERHRVPCERRRELRQRRKPARRWRGRRVERSGSLSLTRIIRRMRMGNSEEAPSAQHGDDHDFLTRDFRRDVALCAALLRRQRL